MTDTFTIPDETESPAPKASDAHTSLAGSIGAQLVGGFLDNPTMRLIRSAREAHAGGEDQAVGQYGEADVYSGVPLETQQSVIDSQKASIPDISQSDAKALLKQESLSESDVPLGDAASHKLPVLQMRIDAAHAKRDRDAAIERGPSGLFPGALGLVTSLGVGMLDPINDAAFMIPVIGEARWGKILASAGDSIAARTALQAGRGAAQGAVGTTALQPFDWWLHTQDGQDYTMAQAMENIAMGAGMGAAFHALPHAYRDWRTRRQGLPLEGSPLDLALRAAPEPGATGEPPAAVAALTPEEVPGITPEAPPPPAVASEGASVASDVPVRATEPPIVASALPLHPGEVIADLPPAAREDALHAAMAGIIHGEPVQAAEMLNIAADHDPRIAETMDSWNAAGEAARAISDIQGGGVKFGVPPTGPSIEVLENLYPEWKRLRARLDIGDITERELDRLDVLNKKVLGHANDRFGEQPHIPGSPPENENVVSREIKTGPRGRAAADPQSWSLFEYLASKGGLKPDPELEAIFGGKKGPMIGGFGPLLRKNGMPLDEALRSAKDGHYLFDNADITGGEASLTPRDLLDRIDEESRGRKIYRLDRAQHDRTISLEEEEGHIVSALHDELEAATGQKGIEIDADLEKRVVEIIQNEGEHDVLAAYERAIMEDEERYNAVNDARAGDPELGHIEGWDVPADQRPASPDGADLAGQGRPAGRPEPGQGGNPGNGARAAGPGDRAPQPAKLKSTPAQAAADPRWRELASVKPDYDDPETLAESEAAEKLPEPDSTLSPMKSLSALEKAAADAEEVWRKLEPTLTEEERALVNDVMDKLKLDAETRAQVIQQGAACLAGAIG